MPWFKVDDHFWSHPKISDLSNDAISLWVRAGSYSAQHLTDGFIPDAVVRRQLWSDKSAAEELAESGLWVVAEGGFQFHDWLQYQPTAADTLSKREAARERVRKARERKRALAEDGSQDVRANTSVTGNEPAANLPRSSQKVRSTPNPNPNPIDTDVSIDPPNPPRGKRGSRLAADWRPTQETVEKIEATCPGLDYKSEHEVFVDYWIAQPGQKGSKVDWDATWRNWMRRKHNDQRARRKPTPTERATQTMRLATDLDLKEVG